MSWTKLPMAVLDFETTGVNVKEDRVVEAAFIVEQEGEVIESYHTIINTGMEIPKEASDVHDITTERMNKEGVAPFQAFAALASLVGKAVGLGWPLVIYNVPFDWPFLKAECSRFGVILDRTPFFLDPLLLDRYFDKYRKGSRSLTTVAEVYGVKLENAHSAIGDTKATLGVLRQIIELYHLEKHYLTDLQKYQKDWYNDWKRGINTYWKKKGEDKEVKNGWPI